jgi:CubicO group peptidase (beta-lactamase class C family)
MTAVPLARCLRLAAACVVLGGVTLLAATPRPLSGAEFDADKLAAIRGRMQVFVDQGDVAGVVTVVGRKDAVLHHEAVGYQDLENRRPMAKDSIFRIASMTKPITAIGVMMLAEEGKLSVEDPVEKYLPEFRGQMLVVGRSKDAVMLAKPARQITIKDLLTHTSGLPGGLPPGLADLYGKRNHTLSEGVIAFSQRPLDFEPGTKWAYCNAGIDTLGRIIEVLSGDSYEAFLSKRIFEPLGMADTTFYPTPDQLGRTALTYAKKDGRLAATTQGFLGPPKGARYPVPAGGLYSTGGDLAKLYQAMLNGGSLGSVRLLKPETVATMTKLQTGALECGFVKGMGFGYGWGVVREPQGVTAMLSPGSYGHGGAYGTQAWLDPKKVVFAVLLIQLTGSTWGDASPLRQELQALAVAAVGK